MRVIYFSPLSAESATINFPPLIAKKILQSKGIQIHPIAHIDTCTTNKRNRKKNNKKRIPMKWYTYIIWEE